MDGVASQPRMRKPRPIASNTRRGRLDPFSEASRAGAPRPLPAGRHGHRKRLRKRRLGARLWLLHAKKQHRAHRQASQPADRGRRQNPQVLLRGAKSVQTTWCWKFSWVFRSQLESYRVSTRGGEDPLPLTGGHLCSFACPPLLTEGDTAPPRQCTDGEQHGQQPRRTLSVVTAGQGVVGGGSFLSRVVVCSFFE